MRTSVCSPSSSSTNQVVRLKSHAKKFSVSRRIGNKATTVKRLYEKRGSKRTVSSINYYTLSVSTRNQSLIGDNLMKSHIER
ncbi:hypothetical protein NDU88_004844 [Pleurodeles waltl]|uniref:Uncharacterized protein n=1 Tax=Pleurodeles waltl TaxID=8319 RepID=A0AAV7T8R9_PLEWA|nr:hypothetical protein NDU88_004844 [Pleurodeles waltl]